MIDAKVGLSSAKHNPFFEVIDNQNKRYYGFNFIYSGNHKEIIETSGFLKQASIQIGINDFLFAYQLKKNDSFTTPEAIMVISDNLDEITKQIHQFAINHIVRPDYKIKSGRLSLIVVRSQSLRLMNNHYLR